MLNIYARYMSVVNIYIYIYIYIVFRIYLLIAKCVYTYPVEVQVYSNPVEVNNPVGGQASCRASIMSRLPKKGQLAIHPKKGLITRAI